MSAEAAAENVEKKDEAGAEVEDEPQVGEKRSGDDQDAPQEKKYVRLHECPYNHIEVYQASADEYLVD